MKASLFVLIAFCVWQIHSAPVPVALQEGYQNGPEQEEQEGGLDQVDVEAEGRIPQSVQDHALLYEERSRSKRQAQEDEETIDADEFRSEVQRSRRHGSHRDYRLCFVPPFPLWCYEYHKKRRKTTCTTSTTTTPISDITTTTTTTTPFSDITTTTSRYPCQWWWMCSSRTTTTTPLSEPTATTTTRRRTTTTTTTTPFSEPTATTTRRTTTTTTPFSEPTATTTTTRRTTTTTPFSESPVTTTTTPFSESPITTTTTPFSEATQTTRHKPRIRFEHAVVKANKKLSKAANIFGYLKKYEQQY